MDLKKLLFGVKYKSDTSELFTLKEVSNLFKVHVNTLRLWDKKGILIAIRIGEKRVRRYRKEDLAKFLDEATP
jgi:predicted site-specific integrase-resolvase